MFGYHPSIVESFPTIRAGLAHATGVDNGATPPALRDAYFSEQQAVLARLDGGTSLAELPSIAAWRRAFSHFGVKPTQYRSAAEALLRRLTKAGDIPSINTLVDIGNLVSIRYGLPVAVVDVAGIAGSLTVRFSDGTEPFTDLASPGTAHPEPGEVVFTDDDGTVHARRWCWRQSAQSATRSSTTEALIVVEGHYEMAGEEVETAVEDLAGLLADHVPGSSCRLWTLP